MPSSPIRPYLTASASAARRSASGSPRVSAMSRIVAVALVERPKQVAADTGKVDPTLAADRGVDQALRGDGHHDQRHAPQPDRRRKDRRLEHGLVADRDRVGHGARVGAQRAGGRATPGSRGPWTVRRRAAPRCPRRSRPRGRCPPRLRRARGSAATSRRRRCAPPTRRGRGRDFDGGWPRRARSTRRGAPHGGRSVPLSTGSLRTGSMRSMVAAIEPDPSIRVPAA